VLHDATIVTGFRDLVRWGAGWLACSLPRCV